MAKGQRFPSLKARQLLAVLKRKPLEYEQTRGDGSHRHLESPNGYKPVTFSWHDGATIGGNTVRKVLVEQVGLSEDEARKLV